MKKFSLVLSILLLFGTLGGPAFACVGRTLMIGTLDSAHEKMLSQLLAVLINERTGTSVTVEYYAGQKELYDAVKAGKVSILIEDAGRALQLLGKEKGETDQATYSLIKEEFKKQFDLVLLDAFGRTQIGSDQKQYLFVPIVTADVLTNYPALPRVIKKLAGISEDKSYPKLIDSVKSGNKPKSTAKDFLKQKRFI